MRDIPRLPPELQDDNSNSNMDAESVSSEFADAQGKKMISSTKKRKRATYSGRRKRLKTGNKKSVVIEDNASSPIPSNEKKNSNEMGEHSEVSPIKSPREMDDEASTTDSRPLNGSVCDETSSTTVISDPINSLISGFPVADQSEPTEELESTSDMESAFLLPKNTAQLFNNYATDTHSQNESPSLPRSESSKELAVDKVGVPSSSGRAVMKNQYSAYLSCDSDKSFKSEDDSNNDEDRKHLSKIEPHSGDGDSGGDVTKNEKVHVSENVENLESLKSEDIDVSPDAVYVEEMTNVSKPTTDNLEKESNSGVPLQKVHGEEAELEKSKDDIDMMDTESEETKPILNGMPEVKKEEKDEDSPAKKEKVENDFSASIKKEVKNEDSSATKKELENDDFPPSIKKEEKDEDSPSRKMEVENEYSAFKKKEVKNEDSPAMKKEVESEGSPPSMKKDMENEDSPPSMKKEEENKDSLAMKKGVNDEDLSDMKTEIRNGLTDSSDMKESVVEDTSSVKEDPVDEEESDEEDVSLSLMLLTINYNNNNH